MAARSDRKASLGLLMALCSLELFRNVEPYHRRSTNLLAYLTQYLIVLTFAVGLMLESGVDKGLSDVSLGITLVVVNLSVIGMVIVTSILRYRKEKEEKKKFKAQKSRKVEWACNFTVDKFSTTFDAYAKNSMPQLSCLVYIYTSLHEADMALKSGLPVKKLASGSHSRHRHLIHNQFSRQAHHHQQQQSTTNNTNGVSGGGGVGGSGDDDPMRGLTGRNHTSFSVGNIPDKNKRNLHVVTDHEEVPPLHKPTSGVLNELSDENDEEEDTYGVLVSLHSPAQYDDIDAEYFQSKEALVACVVARKFLKVLPSNYRGSAGDSLSRSTSMSPTPQSAKSSSSPLQSASSWNNLFSSSATTAAFSTGATNKKKKGNSSNSAPPSPSSPSNPIFQNHHESVNHPTNNNNNNNNDNNNTISKEAELRLANKKRRDDSIRYIPGHILQAIRGTYYGAVASPEMWYQGVVLLPPKVVCRAFQLVRDIDIVSNNNNSSNNNNNNNSNPALLMTSPLSPHVKRDSLLTTDPLMIHPTASHHHQHHQQHHHHHNAHLKVVNISRIYKCHSFLKYTNC
jgi:hypothetical protein